MERVNGVIMTGADDQGSAGFFITAIDLYPEGSGTVEPCIVVNPDSFVSFAVPQYEIANFLNIWSSNLSQQMQDDVYNAFSHVIHMEGNEYVYHGTMPIDFGTMPIGHEAVNDIRLLEEISSAVDNDHYYLTHDTYYDSGVCEQCKFDIFERGDDWRDAPYGV
jgi:hypothetical protein